MINRLVRRWLGGDRPKPRPESVDPASTSAPPRAPGPDARAPAPTEESAEAPYAPSPADARPLDLEGELGARIDGLADGLPEEDADARELLDRLRDGPPSSLRRIPTAAHQILEATRDVDTPRAELVGLIEADPAMAQALLKAANSAAFYSGSGRIASLSHALDRLGMTAARAVVLQQALNGLISRPGGELDVMAGMVWSHMTDAAALARRLAPAFGVDPDEAFATTLLHDAGKMVVFDVCSTLRHDRRRALHLRDEVLSRVLSAVHEPLGGLAARSWGLPDEAARAIATHHRSGGGAGPAPLAECVFLAERVDLARRRRAELELADWWEAGGLTGDREAVEEILAPTGD